MALRTLMKRKELNDATKLLNQARAKADDLTKREAELEQAIAEAETEEERTAVEEAVTEYEQEKAESDEAVRSLEERVASIEKELDDMERAQEPAEGIPAEPAKEERGSEAMDNRAIMMDANKRAAIFEREDVKSFIGEIRSAMKEKRAITNGGLLVPEVFLGLIRENIQEYSKLYKHVNVRRVSGDGRVVIEGTIPEAVWTDCCANVNELGLTFNDAEVACWAVAGYLPVCKSTLEDSDIDLAAEIIAVLGQAIGIALDKAILYGTGTRMPLGIVTRLEQTEAPSDYSATARTWADLTSHIVTTPTSTGVTYFQELLTAFAAASGKYSRGEKVFAMNETTYTNLRVQALSINAAGAIVTGIDAIMPVIGGVIEVLDFIPDGVIIGGYFDLYLLAERSGMTIEESDHAMFLNRKRVYMANARYDGLPVIPEAFVVVQPSGTTDPTFADDTANSGN